MKKTLSTLMLAITLLSAVSMPKKAEAGFFVTAAGVMASGNTALGVTFIGIGMIMVGALAGNATLIVLDQNADQANALVPAVSARFPYLQDQPAVINAIASTINAKIQTLDTQALTAAQTEVKLSNEEVASILDLAILDEAQAQDLTIALQ